MCTNLNFVESMLLKLSNVDDSHSTLHFTKTTFNDFCVFDKLSTKIPLQQIYKFFKFYTVITETLLLCVIKYITVFWLY